MSALPPRTTSACLAALLAAGAARADTATGVDTAQGNALNPPGRSMVPRALSPADADTVRRSPTGQLYQLPATSSEGVATDGGWKVTGSVEGGLLSVDDGARNALFRKYRDVGSGVTLNYFEADVEKAPDGHYLRLSGGGVGRTDQFYGLQVGRYNDWRVGVFYNETPHVFTDTYQSLYSGVGTSRLTLAGGLQPNGGATPVTSGTFTAGSPGYVGATSTCSALAPCWRYTAPDGVVRTYSSATALAGINWTGSGLAAPQPVSPNSIAGAINGVLANTPGGQELGLVRRKGGLQAEFRLAKGWKVYATGTVERRNGARPFSMNENNYTVEIPEPIDYTTLDLLAGLTYADPVTQANLRFSASTFRNSVSTLTVDHPWLAVATAPGAATTTVFDLYPDNTSLGVKGEFARSLPFLRARVNASAGWSTNFQDDALLMPVDPSQSTQMAAVSGSSILRGINNPGYATNTLDLNNWNGVNGSPLSRSSARQRIDAALLNAAFSLKPVDGLDLKADVRFRGTSNSGGYVAYNPLTGQFGRGLRNSSAFDLAVGSAGDPGAIGVPCYTLPGYAAPPGCTFNGVLGVVGQSTNNPANVPVFSPARDVGQLDYGLSAAYDFGKGGSLSALYEREHFFRTFRERDQTWEDRVKAGYVTRGLEYVTVRLSYDGGWRRGSAYHFWPVEDFATGLPGLDWSTLVSQYGKTAAAAPGWLVAPGALQGYLARYARDSRKFDLADRNQHTAIARVNLMPLDSLDLGLTLQYRDAAYPSSGYGLQTDQLTAVDVEVNYQPFTQLQVNASYAWQNAARVQRGNSGTNPLGAVNTCTFPAGSVLSADQAVLGCSQQIWLPDSVWNIHSRDQNHAFALSLQTGAGPLHLGVDYRFSISTSSVDYSYGVNALLPAQAAAAGTAFPDMTLVQHTVTGHLLLELHRRATVHLLYLHETGLIQDWHYAGLPVGASAAENQATLFLDAGPRDYHANVLGVLFQFKL